MLTKIRKVSTFLNLNLSMVNKIGSKQMGRIRMQFRVIEMEIGSLEENQTLEVCLKIVAYILRINHLGHI